MNTKALKQKILDLAIHGKLLTPETIAELKKSPDYETADVLLEKIRKEKEEKIAKGELKRDKKDSFIFSSDCEFFNEKLGKHSEGMRHKRHYEKFADGTVKDIEDEIPFELPDGWAWCRLNEIAEIARGGSPRPIENYITDSEDGINWIKIGDTAPESKYIISAREKIKPEGQKHSRFVHAGDFLLTNSMSFGRPYILKIDGCIHDGWLVFANIKDCIIKDYLYYALSSDYIYNSFSMVAAGSTVKNLKSDTVKQVLFPLPPIQTQERMIKSIEKSFSQIDKIENNKSDLETVIKHTKSKILDLAIHGKLVPQDPNDESASVLLEKLRTEKEEKIAKGELKRDKNDSYIYKGSDNCYYEKFSNGREEEIEVPFDIPENWAWCRLGEICEIITGNTPSKTKPEYFGRDFPFYKPSDLDAGINVINSEDGLSKAGFCISRQLPELSVLVTCIGTIGKTGLIRKAGSCNQQINAIIPNKFIDSFYLFYLCSSNYMQNLIKGESSSTTLPILNKNKFSSLLFPLPPLSEQHRIVAKIEQLFKCTDIINASIKDY